MKREHGFTLLELMIAIIILTFISMGVYKTTASSFSLRENLSRDSDFYNDIRVALDVVGRDISHMYTPQSAAFPGTVGQTPPPPRQGEAAPQPTPNPTLLLSAAAGTLWTFWEPAINMSGVRPARFTGEATKITFVSNSNLRLFKDSPESDFLKVTYALEDDPNGEKGSKALVRHTSTDVFTERDDPEQETVYTMITRVKSLKFSFLDAEKDQWDISPHWDTADGNYKDVFPGMIRLEVEVYTPQSSENTFVISQLYKPELNL